MEQPGMRRALARASGGKALDVAEAAVLLAARGADLEALLAAVVRPLRRPVTRRTNPRPLP